MKIFNYYSDNVDYAWYESSNVVYSKCIDNVDALKTLIVVFNNGGTYQYDDIPVQDYLMFREAQSQGKSLNKIIKKGGYKYSKLEPTDVELLKEEYAERSGNGYFYENEDEFTIYNNFDDNIFKLDKKLDDDTFNLIKDVLNAMHITINPKKRIL